MPKVKNKGRILKAAREKQRVTHKGVPIDCQLISEKKFCKLAGTGKSIQNDGDWDVQRTH